MLEIIRANGGISKPLSEHLDNIYNMHFVYELQKTILRTEKVIMKNNGEIHIVKFSNISHEAVFP
jgi:hypothetical protein